MENFKPDYTKALDKKCTEMTCTECPLTGTYICGVYNSDLPLGSWLNILTEGLIKVKKNLIEGKTEDTK